MRAYGALHPTDQVPLPPDTVTTVLLTGGSSAQAFDMPTDAQMCRITPMTTAGGAFIVFANLTTTGAHVPTSGTTTGSSVSHPVSQASMFQIPGGSTGMSLAAITSGYGFVEFWRK
jgi:hypothetical protein